MATVALPRPIPPHRPTSNVTTPISTSRYVEGSDSSSETQQQYPDPVPNKHIPTCPTGPGKIDEFDTIYSSPGHDNEEQQSSLLYPAEAFKCLYSGNLKILEIDAERISQALAFASDQPLPCPSRVFPWFHGLHPQNHMQQAFFSGNRRGVHKAPSCLRGITIIKANGDLNISRLKGAVAPDELLRSGLVGEFLDADPCEGFSVRNFQIQTTKVALTSDIIVYDDDADKARQIAWDAAAAQQKWREAQLAQDNVPPEYNTFICISKFTEFEESYSELVSVDSSGASSGMVLDFVNQERKEMWNMTEASEISTNVFLGPTPEARSPEEDFYDVLIECSDMGRLDPLALQSIAENPDENVQSFHDFPSSGSILPPTWSHTEADGILDTCKWIYHLSHGSRPKSDINERASEEGGDMLMTDEAEQSTASPRRPRKVLIHCADGYTESTMLSIAYLSYSAGLSTPDAWLTLHTEKRRNFFAYPTDVALLNALTPRILRESPVLAALTLDEMTKMARAEPAWLPGFDGSFPSRVLDYLYLGNLGHANNPDLLKELGIKQILSVGEMATWRDGDLERWGKDNVYVVNGVQDNGIDPLASEFERCLEFINRGREIGTATLVHCRVGVSRSATICIAEVMRALELSFSRAYCFVRARRLNVIIQPHLRFVYELLRWEKTLQKNGDGEADTKRELEWGEIAREIALMNKPYSR